MKIVGKVNILEWIQEAYLFFMRYGIGSWATISKKWLNKTTSSLIIIIPNGGIIHSSLLYRITRMGIILMSFSMTVRAL